MNWGFLLQMLSTECSPLDGGDLPSHEKASSPDLFLSFSIRDYVHSVRSKNISRNWPFSLKNLELCLNHGVIDPLPPFQSPYSVKTGHHHKKNTAKNRFSFQSKPTSCTSSPLKVTPEIPSSVETHSHSEPVRSSSLVEPEPKPETEFFVMASNACPVCKTFASPSNTTLNAHIDQCLSKVETSNWASESNLNRRKVRPRKLKLMADIYATASHCTLEELDRRNGTSWAIVDRPISLVRDPLSVLSDEEERQITLPSEDGYYSKGDNINKVCNDSGAVYIDSSGTKLRILSGFNEKPSALRVGTKIHPSYCMKKGDFQNHGKFLKLPQGKQIDSSNACKFKIHIPQQQKHREKNNQRTIQKPVLSKKSFGKDLHKSFQGSFNARRSFVQRSSDLPENPSSPCSNPRKRSWRPFTSEEISDLIGRPSDSSMVKNLNEPAIDCSIKNVPKSYQNQKKLMKFDGVSSRDSSSSSSLFLEEEIAMSETPEIITENPSTAAVPLNMISRLINPLNGSKDSGNSNFDEMFFGEDEVMRDEFPEVEPIQIPGPPGSFLPSPRAMSSEDLKPNSEDPSRVLSSIDGAGASSATSTISNPSPRLLNLNSPGTDFSRTSPSPFISSEKNSIMENNDTIGVPKMRSSDSSPVLRLMGKNLMVINKESVSSIVGISEEDGLGRSGVIWNGFRGS